MTTQDELEIEVWLSDLSLRCEPRSKENLRVIIAKYAEGLADLPYEAFTTASGEGAARNWERFPSYKALRKFLEDWADKHGAKDTKLLPPIDDPGLSDEDRAHVRSWINLRAERQKSGRFAQALSLMRKWPAAFAYICRTDDEAHATAQQRGWLPETGDTVDVSEAGITERLIELESIAGGSLGAVLAPFGLSILRKNVAARAPERLHLLPDVVLPQRQPREPSERRQDAEAEASARAQREKLQPEIDAASAAFEARTGRKPGQLSPEQLAAVRAQAGIHHPPVQQSPQTIDGDAEEIPPPKQSAKVIDLWGFGDTEEVAA